MGKCLSVLLVQEMLATQAAICSAFSLGTSKNGASVAFTARCASGLSCSKPFPQLGHASKLSLLDFLTNHSPQCQHFTTGVTHISTVSPPSATDPLGRVCSRVLI